MGVCVGAESEKLLRSARGGDHFGRSSVSVCVTGCGANARPTFRSLAWLVLLHCPTSFNDKPQHPPPANFLNDNDHIYTRLNMSRIYVSQNPFPQPPVPLFSRSPSSLISYSSRHHHIRINSHQTELCVTSHLKFCSSSQLPLNSAHLSH